MVARGGREVYDVRVPHAARIGMPDIAAALLDVGYQHDLGILRMRIVREKYPLHLAEAARKCDELRLVELLVSKVEHRIFIEGCIDSAELCIRQGLRKIHVVYFGADDVRRGYDFHD
jgi:hypothetical protein